MIQELVHSRLRVDNRFLKLSIRPLPRPVNVKFWRGGRRGGQGKGAQLWVPDAF